jgi:hypothetical protein
LSVVRRLFRFDVCQSKGTTGSLTTDNRQPTTDMRTTYLDEFEAFSEAYNRAIYGHRSGRDPHLDLEPVYDRYGDLFRREALDELRAESEEAFTERARKCAKHLLADAVEHHLAVAVRPLTEEIATHDALATVEWEGRDLPYRATGSMVTRLERADVRRELARRRERVVQEINDLRSERLEKILESAVALGAESRAALRSELHGVDWAGLASAGERLLGETERPFVDAAELAFREHADVRLANASAADLAHLNRFVGFDDIFRPGRLRSVYRDVFAGLRIRTAAQENVAIDLADRGAKHPRAFCAPVRVPADVRIVLRRRGGYGDYLSILRQGGHAQQLAFTSPSTRVEFRRAGRGAAAEAFALLVESIAREPAWLEGRFGLPRGARGFGKLVALERCASVRRLAALAVYEEQLCSGRLSLASAPSRYAELLAEALAVQTGSARYLAALDEDLPAPERLLARALEVQLRDGFKVRFGSRWWETREAAELLKEIWSAGTEYTAVEVAAELGLGAITLDALEEEVVEELGR